MVMTILLTDPRVASVRVHETYEPLVTLGASFGPARARVRSAVAARLRRAQVALPVGISLRVVEGHCIAATAPIGVALHGSGAAIDLTLVDLFGRELDMGAPLHSTLEESAGRCFLDAPDISAVARERRIQLSRVLTDAGLINYPGGWWHWSYGDRYWALVTGAGAAHYGPVRDLDGPLEDPSGPIGHGLRSRGCR
jgi:D-alanyl-D-alanine dipeptidase